MAEPLVEEGSGTERERAGLLSTSRLDIARLADANIADPSSDCISGAITLSIYLSIYYCNISDSRVSILTLYMYV